MGDDGTVKSQARDYSDYQIDKLSSDPGEALLYLEAALEEYLKDGNNDAMRIALETFDKARGRRLGKTLAAEKYHSIHTA